MYAKSPPTLQMCVVPYFPGAAAAPMSLFYGDPWSFPDLHLAMRRLLVVSRLSAFSRQRLAFSRGLGIMVFLAFTRARHEREVAEEANG